MNIVRFVGQKMKLSRPTFSSRRFISSALCSFNKSVTSTVEKKQHENKPIDLKFMTKEGPSIQHFIANANAKSLPLRNAALIKEHVPYLDPDVGKVKHKKVFVETYGCQMNVSDTEIVWSILKENGYLKSETINESDIILVMTCAIREGAEQKIWRRLQYLKSFKKKKKSLKIGLLGCMAERLKTKILEKEQLVDVVCGPDAYRDLPRLLAVTESGQAAVNVLLSLDETYADVLPVRISENTRTAFVSIMRGCDNLCSYCIVPFTRGRERSRPIASIIEEVRALSYQGIKEVTLLGQNVNSYRDTSEYTSFGGIDRESATNLSSGFKTIYKHKTGGRRFSDLLDEVSKVDPEMRIRFTSPHPKDFPDEVLDLIKERDNICNHLHLPAQSGNDDVLRAMRRGYTREAYLNLVERIRGIIPDVALTSDFIAGFCGETEAAHEDTLSLMTHVQYNYAYCFAYSMRAKTNAYHKLKDDVCQEDKNRRAAELIDAFRQQALHLNEAQCGQTQLVLLEGKSKRSESYFAGRNDGNTKVIIADLEIPCDSTSKKLRTMKPGDYIVTEITGGSSQVLKGMPLYHTTLQEFSIQKRL